MKSMTSKEIREAYIEFFKKKGHEYIDSHSVIPFEDPTILFTNSGMNQLKSYFLSTMENHNAITKWVIQFQKCIRASGIHNDVDNIGKDLNHHTFFEMLGCWSFGDYFRKNQLRMCEWAWKFLTEELEIPVNRLYVSYFGGNIKANLDPDIEAKELWLFLGVPDTNIVPGSMEENFWEMAKTGLCGPCCKIHYDHVGNRDAKYLVNTGDPDVVEFWNFVFIQYDREPNGSLSCLPNKHIDSELGLERLTAIMQGKRDNYDTDIFAPLLQAIEKATGARKYSGKVGKKDKDGIDTAYRIVADHARTITVALADGGELNQTERGYILKKVIRRAVLYATETLKAEPGVFGSLVKVVVDNLGDVYPELKRFPQSIINVINTDEKQFLENLPKGRQSLDEEIAKVGANKLVSSTVAWSLHSNYGFPVEITQLFVKRKGMKLRIEPHDIEDTIAKSVKNRDMTPYYTSTFGYSYH